MKDNQTKTKRLDSSLMEVDAEHDRKRKPKRTRNARRRSKATDEREQERHLTSLLFGSGDYPILSAEKRAWSDPDDAIEENAALFEIDRTGGDDVDTVGAAGMEHPTAPIATAIRSEDDEKTGGDAWIDEDDDELEVNLLETSRLRKLRKTRTENAASALSGKELEERLRQRYQTTVQATARTDWARMDDQVDSNDDVDENEGHGLHSSSASLLFQSSSRRLAPSTLSLVRCPDANQSDPNQSAVQVVNFHPGSDSDRPLMLTAGLDKTLRFFQVGAEKSEKVHGIHCKRRGIIYPADELF
jgi:hypothetical protein